MIEHNNPYEAPQAPLEGHSGNTVALHDPTNLVGPGKRFVNSLIDGIAIFILINIIDIAIAAIFPPKAHTYGCLLALFNMVFNFIFYVSFEYYTGKTPGKYVTKTTVVNDYGVRPSLLQILGRSAARFIPFECFTFFDAQSRGWHDSMSNTFVVSDNAA